jgi:hypothetical protein
MTKLDEQISLEDLLAAKAGVPKLVDILSDLPPYKITPILIKISKERVKKISPPDLLKAYDAKLDFFGVSCLSQDEILKFKRTFYSILPEHFDSVEISPIAPLGANSVITNISQDKVMSTTRGSEVVGDPTTSLILEAASRRKKYAKSNNFDRKVDLATFHRVLRMQSFDKSKGYMQQFNLLGMASAGKDKNYQKFVAEVFLEHISILLEFVNELNDSYYCFRNVTVKISSTRILENIINSLDISREEITKNSNNESFDFFKNYGVEIPNEVLTVDELSESLAEKYNLTEVISKMKYIEENLLEALRMKYPDVNVKFCFNRVAGIGYYRDYCFHIFAENDQGRNVQLSDGGSVDYVAKLVSDKKEYAVTSGIGAELVQKLFMKK